VRPTRESIEPPGNERLDVGVTESALVVVCGCRIKWVTPGKAGAANVWSAASAADSAARTFTLSCHAVVRIGVRLASTVETSRLDR